MMEELTKTVEQKKKMTHPHDMTFFLYIFLSLILLQFYYKRKFIFQIHSINDMFNK